MICFSETLCFIFKMLALCVIFLIYLSRCFADDYEDVYVKNAPTNYDHEIFPSLAGKINALPANESTYPWIAKIVHSRTNDKPLVCTAVCIDKQIFISSGRIPRSIKVSYTTIIYMKHRFKLRALILPSVRSKGSFDDISFLVVEPSDGFKQKWETVELISENRTDPYFRWFAKLRYSEREIQHRVIGYGDWNSKVMAEKPLQYLDVLVGLNLCHKTYKVNDVKEPYPSFKVPCYHSCVENATSTHCNRYHGAEGSAVYNFKTKQLLGIATWGYYSTWHTNTTYPVGIALVNSNNFFEDYACAKVVRHFTATATPGLYQKLCDDNKVKNRNPK